MDYAQLQNSAFKIVNDYFDLTKVIKQSFQTNQSIAKRKNVHLEGPIFAEENNSIFFSRLYGDSRRYL